MILPDKDCDRCPELCAHRHILRHEHTDWYNAPVHGFGDSHAAIFIIGLAPGQRGANRTGRPFTGDRAGDYLYHALAQHGFTQGQYGGHADDGLILKNVFISNGVKCAPPKHRDVTPQEKKNCRLFLRSELESLRDVKVILTLGQTAHVALFETLAEVDSDIKPRQYKFGHKNIHEIATAKTRLRVVNSYHCSQRNINTKILRLEDFFSVFALICAMVADKNQQQYN